VNPNTNRRAAAVERSTPDALEVAEVEASGGGGALDCGGSLDGGAKERADRRAGHDQDGDAAERRARRRVDLSQGRGHRRPTMAAVRASDPRRPAVPVTSHGCTGAAR
jgi:hypothetical protein